MVFRFLILLFLLLSTSCKDIKQDVENQYASTFQNDDTDCDFLKIREFMFDGDRYNDVEKTLRGGRFQRNVGHSSQCCKQNDAENPLRNRLQHCVFSVVQIFFRDLQF